MTRKLCVLVSVTAVVLAGISWVSIASDAQMYFASDKNGQNRVTNIQEGDEIWIAIIDADENIDCDVRDKIWTDVKIMDPKTGAYIVWRSYLDENGDANDNRYEQEEYVPYKGHYPGDTAGWTGGDYLEETGADTGVFVSRRAFQVGTREDYDDPFNSTHVVDDAVRPDPNGGYPYDFQWGNYLYTNQDSTNEEMTNIEADDRRWMNAEWEEIPGYSYGDAPQIGSPGFFPSEVMDGNEGALDYLIGRFENMDTLVGMYQDQNDPTDVAIAMMKIIDTEASMNWDREIYKDANTSAMITVVDPDENLNCNQVEYVPVFIIVNPGSWNPVRFSAAEGEDPAFSSPTNFCALKYTGGVAPEDEDEGPWTFTEGMPLIDDNSEHSIRWYNIYGNQIDWDDYVPGAYYMEYPLAGEDDAWGNPQPNSFDTIDDDGFVKVSFHAQETGVNTGVFQLNLNSILVDLEFNSLGVRDVLVAYYLDPNDEDDFKIATAYIEERQHSVVSFTDETRADKDLYWLGRDPIYVQVIDANANVDPCCPEQVVVHVCDPHGEDDSEFLILDETSSNSPVFFTFAGMKLRAAWDALGIGLSFGSANDGGFQIQWDNWMFEAFNEDDILVRYNDMYYETDDRGLAGLGDAQAFGDVSPFPPRIDRPRAANDVSFDLMSVGDTQVYDGSTTNMWFLDRQGNRVSGYANSDCVFIEVLDPDQNEDQYRRERIDGFWDQRVEPGYVLDGQNVPFGPEDFSDNHLDCGFQNDEDHPLNALLGDTNIFWSSDNDSYEMGEAKLYVLNPRNGHWAPVDLMETGAATGDFVSVICIELTNVYECVPSLYVQPGDTLIAVYQDPTNHSDSAWISIKVGIGGGGTPPAQQSTTAFVDVNGNEIAAYTDADTVVVKVIDPSHAGVALLAGALTVEGEAFDVLAVDGEPGVFLTEGLDLSLTVGDSLTAEYTDPTDLTDISSDTITVIAGALVVDSFYAGPNPFETEVTFGFNGTGIASQMTVCVYDLAGGMVFEATQTDVSVMTWDGAGLANGAYIYTITATDGTNSYTGKGKVFVKR